MERKRLIIPSGLAVAVLPLAGACAGGKGEVRGVQVENPNSTPSATVSLNPEGTSFATPLITPTLTAEATCTPEQRNQLVAGVDQLILEIQNPDPVIIPPEPAKKAWESLVNWELNGNSSVGVPDGLLGIKRDLENGDLKSAKEKMTALPNYSKKVPYLFQMVAEPVLQRPDSGFGEPPDIWTAERIGQIDPDGKFINQHFIDGYFKPGVGFSRLGEKQVIGFIDLYYSVDACSK